MDELNTQYQELIGNRRPIQQGVNEVGLAGFIVSIVAILIGWVPIIGWILGGFIWLAGLILSFIGLFKEPKGFAIAGFIISIVSFLLLVLIIGGILGLINYFDVPNNFGIQV